MRTLIYGLGNYSFLKLMLVLLFLLSKQIFSSFVGVWVMLTQHNLYLETIILNTCY